MTPARPERLRGLYAITPDWPDTATLVAAVGAAVAGGAVLVQYRNKCAMPALRREQAAALQTVCVTAGVPLIINDDIDLACELGAGVHIGRDDAPPALARAHLGSGGLLGVSCYNELAHAQAAVAAGADYIAFGAMYPSATKPGGARASLDLLHEAKSRYTLPVAAIGGIRLDNAAALIAAGADLLAVVSDLFDNSDIAARAAAYAALFASMESRA